jgi:hypothetical protein
MMRARTQSNSAWILLALLCLSTIAFSASVPALSGGIVGEVKGASGVAQMGATVLLYDRYDRLIRQVLTNDQGRFAFDALPPDLYSIRVTLASFIPAMLRNISVTPGSESVLHINLATLLSSVDLTSSPSRGTLMTDDWKWVLRTSQATRPVLRFLPDNASSSSSSSTATVFSDVTGLVKLSAGDGESFNTASQQDMGTAFAVATSVNGSARVQFSGNFGYAGNSGVPAGGFRTTYSKDQDGFGPEMALTVRQLYLPIRGGAAIGGPDGVPSLRTMSLAMQDKIALSDVLNLEYGMSIESVTFLQRLNYLSPFVRATYRVDDKSSVRVAYSSGAEPTELIARSGEPGGDLTQDLAALALLPRISLSDNQPRVQRTQTFEAGYQRVQGDRKYSVGFYREAVTNAAFLMSGPSDFVPASDTLPNFGTQSQIFNVGNFEDFGYTAAVTQSFGDHMEATLGAGRGGALVADGQGALSSDPNDVRSQIRQAQRSWVTARVSGTLPGSGTRLTTDYGWTDFRAVMPEHAFLAQESVEDTGWNIRIRQPLPILSGWPGRFEATIDLRNLLAQGYLPLAAGGRRAVLTNSPRAVRGGLSFVF